MADPNQQGGGGGGGDNQGKNKGGGGGGKEGISLNANINASNMSGGWGAVKRNLADRGLEALGLIAAGLIIYAMRKPAYKVFGITETEVKPKPNAWEGAQAIRDMKKDKPEQYAKFAEKNSDLFPAASIDVTPDA